MTIHIPTAIQLLFAMDDTVEYIKEERSKARPYLNVISNMFIADDFLEDHLTCAYTPIEQLYIDTVQWDVIYEPTQEEHLELYRIFFKETITEIPPISDTELLNKLSKTYYTPYIRWCCAICQILWKFASKEIKYTELSNVSKKTLRYIRNSIYRDMPQVIDVEFSEINTRPVNSLRQKLRDRELR